MLPSDLTPEQILSKAKLLNEVSAALTEITDKQETEEDRRCVLLATVYVVAMAVHNTVCCQKHGLELWGEIGNEIIADMSEEELDHAKAFASLDTNAPSN